MKDVHTVSVMYHGRKVGTLSMGNRSNCQFEYDKDWLTDGFSISPLKLPLKAGLFTADYQPFNGNFGVFEDSLPGGYGEYLLRKVLKKSGIDPQALTPVQWLSIIGSSVVWLSMSMPKIWMTMHVISALSAARACGL